MGHQSHCVIVFLLGTIFYVVKCQTTPPLDWQYDPYSTDQWFKQKQDHYGSSNIQNWPQRYVTSYRFYRLGGPMFLYLSGPGPELTLTDIETGAIAQYAEEQGAFVIGLEHRFYGKSRPTSDLSTENLHLLTIPQTIEDIAAFIRSWRGRDEFRNSKWVIFGASYLGSLATWFAQKHPELIDTFVASSAPLELRYEIPEFLENVGQIINETNPKCYDTVAEGFSCLSKIFNEEECQNYSLSDVKEKFDFCADLDRTRPLDATGVFAELFSTVNAVVMYHDPSPDSFPDTNLDRFCKHITVEGDGRGVLDKIGDKVKEINKHRGVPCAEFRFQTTVDFLKEKEWDSPAAKEGYRQLQWQLCNELGWTVASANISQPFGNYLTPFLHSEICQNLFGLTETEMRLKVLKANTDLKGKNINTQCGIFVNGDKDPWHTFSITTPEEAGKCNRAILIEGGSHGRDIEDFSSGTSYPNQLREAQLKIAGYLDRWLKTGSCCDEDPAESKRVISTLSRPARAPNTGELYYAFNNLLKQPKVEVKPRAYSDGWGERLLASPTSFPHQLSTTDVLSVSPRIPVMGDTQENQNLKHINAGIYRDPRNDEFRRFRVVKLLRHRPSFASTPAPEPSMAPSMEQFEADFPEHSIRVEGRVERVYKNGTIIKTTETPTLSMNDDDDELNEQLDMFGKGRRLLNPEITSNEVTAEETDKEGIVEARKGKGFKYVVKQVFKDVVGVEDTNNNTEVETQSGSADVPLSMESSQSASYESPEVSSSPEKSSQDNQSTDNEKKENLSLVEDESLSQEISKSVEEGSSDGNKSIQKQESGEQNKPAESDKDESISTSDSVESTSILPKQNKNQKKSEENAEHMKPDKKGKEKEENDDFEDDDGYEDDDEYYDDDDDYYDEDDDSNEKPNNVSTKPTQKAKTSQVQVTKGTVKPAAVPDSDEESADSATDFDSGEDGKSKRLREKISEKIMSSSETVEGDQKSKEKSTTTKNKHNRKSNTKPKAISDSNESPEDVDSSGEDYNYSLEPSGSDPQRSYKKKQLAPLYKPVIEEPSTVINVEISGSYPRRSQRKRKSKKVTTEAPKLTENQDHSSESNSVEELITTTEKPKTTTTTRRSHRKKKEKFSRSKSSRNVTTTSKPSSTTTPSTPSTTTSTSTPITTSVPDFTEPPPTNSYATWNKGRYPNTVEALPVQQEAPTIVNLDGGNPPGDFTSQLNDDSNPQKFSRNNDVMYIIIGDIPEEDNENMVDSNPSPEALFKFIQKLVSRHSPSGFPPKAQPLYTPPPPPTTTTTTTTTPAPVVSNHNFHAHTGKYLLVRPVQVVSVGQGHVVHSQDLKNDSLIDLMTMETPLHPYPYQMQVQNTKRQNNEGYRFKSSLHRDHFERLLSVDGQVRDSDRDIGGFRHSVRRLDQIPDPSWRSIRGLSQFGPVASSQKNNPVSGLLSLSAADTMWVNDGVPFLPRHRQFSAGSHHQNSA